MSCSIVKSISILESRASVSMNSERTLATFQVKKLFVVTFAYSFCMVVFTGHYALGVLIKIILTCI